MRFDRLKNHLTLIEHIPKGRYDIYKCSCGTIKKIKRSHVNIGKIKTCGQCCIKQLPGTIFEKLYILEYVGQRYGNRGAYQFKCKCYCGKELIVDATRLTKKNNKYTSSCGNCIDKSYMLGKKFGLLTVNQWLDIDDNGNSIWQCTCECGNKHEANSCNLKNSVKSCGCLKQNSPLLFGENKGKASRAKNEEVMLIRNMYYLERLMRRKHRTGNRKYKYNMYDIAKELGLGYHIVQSVIKSDRWRHLPNPNDVHGKDLRDSLYLYPKD